MARYYFDLFDGLKIDRDDIGFDCADLAAARDAAVEALGEVTRGSFTGWVAATPRHEGS
jgi:hypothetical protein